MKKNKVFLITSIITMLPTIAGLLIWNKLPNSIATHFTMNGVANQFNSKSFTVFFIPMILLAAHTISYFATSMDKREDKVSKKMKNILFWIIPVISCIVMGSIYMKALGYNINIPMVAILLVSIIQVLIGNYLPKCKQNGTVGIRIAWTMKSEKNWNKTHRFAGKLYVLSGFLSIVLSLCGFNYMYIFFIVMISMFLPIAYSFAIRKNI
nr:SdpI family protein [uncultured Peptostreptococcus sp.]